MNGRRFAVDNDGVKEQQVVFGAKMALIESLYSNLFRHYCE